MRSNRDLQLITEYDTKFFDYHNFVDRLSDKLARRETDISGVVTEIGKYCKIHKGCDPDLILEDIEYNAYYKMDYQNDVLRAGINKMKSIRSSTMNNINGTSGKNTITFNSAEEIYDVLHSDQDLYCIDDEIYMFRYSEQGSIVYYYLTMKQLMELAQEADGYIGSVLGPGGYIVDIDESLYDDPGDEYLAEIYDFLDGFVGKEFIYANVDDLI